MNKRNWTANGDQWLVAFKAEFLRRTGITWNEGAGNEDEDAIERYFPEDVSDAVGHYIEKYDMADITETGW